MRFPDHFLAEIKDRVSVLSVCSRRVTLKKAGVEWCGLSPFNTERKPSFYVNERKQAWFDFSAQLNGDIFKFVMLTEGISFADAVETLAAEAGVPMPSGWKRGVHDTHTFDAEKAARDEAWRLKTEARDVKEARDKNNVRRIAYEIWRKGIATKNTLAEIYLKSRGVEFATEFTSLRFVARLEHHDTDTDSIIRRPALIGAIRAPDDGRFLAIQRIFLTEDGSDYVAKVTLGSFTPWGGSLWLGPPGAIANPCEGIETGCGVYGLLRQRQGVQAAISTSGMINFIPPKGCTSVLIWPDGDVAKIRADKRTGVEKTLASAGLRAAKTLNLRLTDAKVPCSIQPIPGRAIDWLDCYNASKGILNNG